MDKKKRRALKRAAKRDKTKREPMLTREEIRAGKLGWERR